MSDESNRLLLKHHLEIKFPRFSGHRWVRLRKQKSDD